MKGFEKKPGASNEEAELEPRQQTLIIGGWASVCGNCGRNADPKEISHEMRTMEGGPGCGVEYKYVTNDGINKEAAQRLCPGLEWVDADPSRDGAAGAMEDQMIGDLPVVGPIHPNAHLN